MLFLGTNVCAKNYYFEQISLNQGLSQSTVKAVYRDHIGLLWIGTKEGLNRYDGAHVRTYRADVGKENSLPANNIYFIVEDSNQNLWIGTDGPICRFSRAKDAFITEKINGKEVSLRNALVAGDFMYSVSGSTLYIYNSRENTWTEKAFSGDDTNMTPNSKLIKLDNGKILIGSRWKGLYECDLQTGKIKRAPYCKAQNILSVYRDSKKRLWVSEFGKGVWCYDSKGKLIRDLSYVQGFKNDKVMEIIQHKGKIWMVTDGNGVVVYTPERDEFQKIGHELDNPFSLPVNSFMTIYSDKYDNLWLGSIRGGLIGVRSVHVQSYQNAPLNSAFGLSDQTVLSFFEDEDEMVWVGTDGEGINRYNPQTGKFTHFPATYGKKISGITSYSGNLLLISVYKEGLILFNKQTGAVFPFRFKNNPYILQNNWIGVSVQDGGNGIIYLADEKVYAYTISTGEVRELKVTRNGEGPTRVYKSQLLPGHLILCSNKSVRILNLATNRVERGLVVNPETTGEINVAEVDKSGTFWLGTSTGFYVMNPKAKGLNRIKPALINSVSSLVYDKNESFWIGSGLNLYRYSAADHQLIQYRKSDGVNTNEYLPKPRLCGRKGDVYLGGVSGFCRIDANIPPKKADNPVFEILDIQLNGTLVPEKDIRREDKATSLTVPWNYTSLVVNVFMNTPELSNFKRARYAISGYSDRYLDLENQSVSLQSLPPGKYTLQVQTELKNEAWSKPLDLLYIRVTPPWWRTWWFYLFVMALAGFSLFRFRKSAIAKTRRNMEMKMKEHERELSEQKIRFLINISHELRTPLTLVYAPLRRMLKDEKTPEALKPLLTLMYKHVKSMKNMIDMVLDVRKMEIKSEKPNKQPYVFNEWVQEIVDDFAFEFEAKQVALVTEPDARIGTVCFDRNLCDKVLSNLLMNALKFSEPGTRVVVRSEWFENRVQLSVADEGIGVDPADVPNLFTRFYQTRHEKGGTGIGLSFAKTQVEAHGGTIGYRPAEPKGSIFWFELPLDDSAVVVADTSEKIMVEAGERQLPENSSVGDAVDFGKLTVLIAEDEPDLVAYMKQSLSEVFKTVITAGNGDEALKKVYQYNPDLVISDVMMPVMDGFELCRTLKTDVSISHIPVILLTALGDEDSSLTGYKMGADLYLSKPFGVDVLIAILSNLFRNRNDLKKRYALPDVPVSTQDITFSNADENFLVKLIGLIENRLDDVDLRIDELAGEMAMSRTSFYNKVKLVTGISANAFIVDYKIKKATQLLHDPNLPIQEIAMRLGFVNQRYFSTVFKQVTGKTPTQYRSGI